uniref:Uncharacterized protein n=1 Tax=Octopus bimaculoides TaxID=37653 RepID=A0A0L8GUN7_OCTBM
MFCQEQHFLLIKGQAIVLSTNLDVFTERRIMPITSLIQIPRSALTILVSHGALRSESHPSKVS